MPDPLPVPAPLPPAQPVPQPFAEPDPATEVDALVRRARDRVRRVTGATALLFALAGLLAVAPAILAVAATGSGIARALAILALAAAAAAWAWFGPLRARALAGDDDAAARLLAGRVPQVRRDLLTAVQLARDLRRPGQDPPFSPALARAHIAAAAQSAAGVDLTAVVPDRPVTRAAFAALAAAALVAVLVAAAPDLLRRGLFELARGHDAGGGAGLDARKEPITGEIELTYLYPAYTGLDPRTVPGTNGEIVAPAGTEVRLKTRADRDLARAQVVVDGHAHPLTVDGRNLAGAFTVASPGHYAFRFVDRRDRVIAQGPPIPIAIEKDEAPKVTIYTPAPSVEVDPRGGVALRYEAEDDYGLSGVALVYKLPGAKEPSRQTLPGGGNGRHARGESSWDLPALGLMPGDAVSYYLEVKDNDAVAGPKTGVSRTQSIKVYSEAEHHRRAIARLEAVWERLVVHLADRIEGPDRARERAPNAIGDAARLDDKGFSIADDLRALGRALRKDRSPDELARAASAVGGSLRESTGQLAGARTAYLRLARRGVDEAAYGRVLGEAATRDIAEVEKDVVYLESLLDQRRMKDLLAFAKELAARRRDLAALLERYRDAPDAATRARIEQEIARLKERMAELLERMAELSRGIRDEHLNAEALAEMAREQDLLGSLDEVQRLLNAGEIDKALAALQKLGSQLDAMQDALARAQRRHGEDGEFTELGRDIARFAEDLSQLTADQEELAGRTQKIRNAYKRALAERLARKGEDFAERLREKVEKARQRMSEVPDAELPSSADNPLRAAAEYLETLEQALQVKDFDEARQAADKSLRAVRSLHEEFDRLARASESVRFLGPAPDPVSMQKGRAATGKALPLVREVKDALDELNPAAPETLTPEDAARLAEMGGEQDGLQGRARGLDEQMQQIGRRAPVFPQSSQQQMRQAQQRMGQASGKMAAKSPGGAVAEQRAALENLRQIRKGIDEALQKGGGPGAIPVPLGEPGEDSDGYDGDRMAMQKVEIPGAEQYQVPEEFRKDILDAMRNAAPEKYRTPVKRYYEEIVK